MIATDAERLVKRLVLFDIDGTLLITKGATTRCIHRVCKSMFGESFKWGGVTSGTLDPQIFADLLLHNGIADAASHHARYRELYFADFKAELERVRDDVTVLPGIRDVLAQLRETENITCGVLTGNYRETALIKLKAAGFDLNQFQVNAFAEDANDRPGLVRAAMRKFGSDTRGEAVVIVGDTPNDIACAKANGCFAFCVATGHYDVKTLKKAGADRVVKDLSDPTPLLSVLGVSENLTRPVR
jgi:phosphoglycolate phosphatase-like HAD superfamily hydrolase